MHFAAFYALRLRATTSRGWPHIALNALRRLFPIFRRAIVSFPHIIRSILGGLCFLALQATIRIESSRFATWLTVTDRSTKDTRPLSYTNSYLLSHQIARSRKLL